jgi:ribose transport system substrate-binding protein
LNKSHYTAIFITLAICFTALLTFFIAEKNRDVSGDKTDNHVTVKMILKAKANPPDFWRIVEQGAQDAALEYGVSCEVTGPTAEGEIDGQIRLMEQAIAQKPDAIILAAADYDKLVPVCEKAVEAGILLLTVDSDVNFKETRSFVSTDNVELGKKLAQQLHSLIGPTDQFGVIGHVKTVTTAVQREKGLIDNVENVSQRLVGVAYCNGSVERARKQAKEMILGNPGIRGMVGLNESSALGIAYALQDLGMGGKIKLVACDSSEELIPLMEQGIIQAFVIQNPFNMGYISVKNAVDLLQKKDVPKFYDTKSVVVTKKTLYVKENQKLLFPFTDTK